MGAWEGCVRAGSGTTQEVRIGDRVFVYTASREKEDQVIICGERNGKKIVPLSPMDNVIPALKVCCHGNLKGKAVIAVCGKNKNKIRI